MRASVWPILVAVMCGWGLGAEARDPPTSRVHSLVLTTDDVFIFDEVFFADTNFIQMLQENYQPPRWSDFVHLQPMARDPHSEFIRPLVFKDTEVVQKCKELPDLGVHWIGMTKHERKAPPKSEFFSVREVPISGPRLNRFLTSHRSKGAEVQRSGSLLQPVDETYHFREGQDFRVWRDFKVTPGMLEVYTIIWKLRQGFLFYITHIVMDLRTGLDVVHGNFFSEFRRVHVQTIRVAEGNFLRYSFYKAVPNFFAGYLLVFQSLTRNNYFFAYQPTDPAELTRNEGTTMLASLQATFENDFQAVLDPDGTELTFEIFPLIDSKDLIESQQRILMVSYGKFRRLYEIDKYRGFEVVSIRTFHSYLDLSRYNPWFYLYLRDLRDAQSLLDIFSTRPGLRLLASNTQTHHFYVNPRKNLLLLIRFPRMNFRHLALRLLSYHPFMSTFGPERSFRLLFCPLSALSFLEYHELLSFHVFLFRNDTSIVVYRALRYGPAIDLPREAEVPCQLESVVPSYFSNHVLLICKGKIFVLKFMKNIFRATFGPLVAANDKVLVNYNLALSYPAAPHDAGQKGVVVENLLLKFLHGHNPETGILTRFLETQRLNFLDSYTLCKDYVFTGGLLAFDLQVLDQSRRLLETHDYAPLEKTIAFNFEQVVKMHAFSLTDSSLGDRDSILNAKLYLLLQTRDNILYLHEGMAKFIDSRNSERFLRLSNVRRLLQCDLRRRLYYLGTLLIGCGHPNGIHYYRFQRANRSFTPVPELQDCHTLNFHQRDKIFICVRRSGVQVYSIARGRLHLLGNWNAASDSHLHFYSAQLRSEHLIRYRPITGKQSAFGIEISQVLVGADDRLFSRHLMSRELEVSWETDCDLVAEKNLIVLLCRNSYYVWYVNLDEQVCVPTKSGPLRLGVHRITRIDTFEPQVIFYSNRFFHNPLSSSQGLELVIAFPGCVNDQCGILHFNAAAPKISTFAEFTFLHAAEEDLWGLYMFSQFDVVAEDRKADSEPLFRGYMVTRGSPSPVEAGYLFSYKTRVFYPFKPHFVLDLHRFATQDFLTLQATPYRQPNLDPEDPSPVRLTIERTKERQLDVHVKPSDRWIVRVPTSDLNFHRFRLRWTRFVSSHVLDVSLHTSFLADNFVDVARLSPRFLQETLLEFDPEVTKIIQLCDTRPILNLVDDARLFFVQSDSNIFRFENRQLTTVYAVNKYLHLPVSFLTTINDFDCTFRMISKTAVVLVLCRQRHTQEPHKLFNMVSLDGSLERSIDFLNFLERIRTRAYERIVIRKNYILLRKQQMESKRQETDVMYPFLILRSDRKPLFWYSDPLSVSPRHLYNKIHWIRNGSVWFAVHFSIEDSNDGSFVAFSLEIWLGQRLCQAFQEQLRSVGLSELVRKASPRQMISQMSKRGVYFAFPVKMKYLVALQLSFRFKEGFPDAKRVFEAEFRGFVFLNLKRNEFRVAFWKIQVDTKAHKPSLIYLPSRKGSLGFLIRTANSDYVNVIWFEDFPFNRPNPNIFFFQPIKEEEAWTSYLGPNMVAYLDGQARYPFFTRMFPAHSILSVRMLATSRLQLQGTPEGHHVSFDYLLLLKDRVEVLRVFQRQTLELSKAYFRSNELVFTVKSPMHVVRYIVNVKKFRDYFQIPQKTGVYDGHYLVAFGVVLLLGGFGVPLLEWWANRRRKRIRIRI